MILRIKQFFLILLATVLVSCATYYQINAEFNSNFEQGNLETAESILDNNKRARKGKARFLYYANQGVVNSMLGNLEESNEWFEKAYLFGEDYHKNGLDIAASFVTNPNSIVYPGEDHEHLLLLYYKTINLVKMKDYESALIECRRLINRLNELGDKYKSEKKYQRDAFIHNLMGIIFEATGDHNNAFIAYRNALDIYEEDYATMFGMGVPQQLKKDVIRSAAKTGFMDQVDFFERKFGIKYSPEPSGPELVFFWHNGLGPVKDEWSINFTVVDNGFGVVTFVNEEYDFSFPFPVANEQERSQLTDLRVFRVAFPKYKERPPVFQQGILTMNGQDYPLDKAQDINAIAFKTLQERMMAEFGKALLRFAVKKSIEMAIRGDFEKDKGGEKTEQQRKEENMREGLALLVGVLNAATEKADTRNWQTIPHDIYYTRIPLDTGQNNVMFHMSAVNGRSMEQSFIFNAKRGETVFHTYQSLESSINHK